MASPIGAFINGAFRGYEYGEGDKDRKRRRSIFDERHEMLVEDRDRGHRIEDERMGYLREDRGEAAIDRSRSRGFEDEDRSYLREDRWRSRGIEDERLGWARTDRARADSQYERGAAAAQEERAMLQSTFGPNAAALHRTLVDSGVPAHVASGIVGNAVQESGPDLDPKAVGDNGNSVGFAQWNGPRREALMEFSRQNSLDPMSFDTQAKFLLHEGQTTEQGAWRAMMAAQTPEEAARIGSEKFWRPGDPRNENRMRYATEFHRSLAQGSPGRAGDPMVLDPIEVRPEGGSRAQSGRGVTGKVAPAQERRAVDALIQDAVPKMMQFYLSRGEFDKASAFEEWAGSRQVKGQLESWGKAVFAASHGDEDGFLDHLAKTYNMIDDGIGVIRDKSFFIKDERGNTVGAKVTFVDQETGKQFERQFDGQEDLIQMAVFALSPQQVFDRMWSMTEQAASARASRAASEHVARPEMIEMVAKEADSIRKGQAQVIDPKDRLTEDQIEAIAYQNVMQRLSGNPPRRSPPPDYEG